jgi:signal transduction histidine kinase
MQSRKLPTLAYLSEKIYSYKTESELISETTQLITNELNLLGSVIFLIDDDKLRAKSTTGEDMPSCEITISREDNYIATTFKEDRIIQSNEISKFSKCLAKREEIVGSAVSIPLKIEEKIIGVILFLKDKHSDLKEQIEMLKVLVFIIGAAINNRKYIDKLEQKISLIERLNQEQKYLLDIIAHELKSPLTVLSANHQLIEKFIEAHPNTEELQKIISANKRALAKQNKILSDLYKFAKEDKETENINFKHINLHALIVEVVENESKIRNFAGDEKSNVVTILDIEDIKNDEFFLDHTRIHEILTNLISNAYKYTNKGEVKVSANYNQEEAKLKVVIEDTGIGINQEDQDRIWRKFARIDQRNYDNVNVEGTGLGLYIVKKICNQIGADLNLESQKNHGSKFTLILNEVRKKEG